MRKIFFAALCAITFAVTAQAQDQQKSVNSRRVQHKQINPEQRAERMTQRMEKEYKLSPEQRQRVHQENVQNIKELNRIRQERHRDARVEMQQVQSARTQRMRTILNREQFQKMEAKQEAVKQRRAQGIDRNGAHRQR